MARIDEPKPLAETVDAQLERLRAVQERIKQREGGAPPVAVSPANTPDLYGRLVRRFGLGAKPLVRQSFFRRLAALTEEHGDKVYRPIAESVAQSVGRNHPDRYFCSTVVAKLREIGLFPQADSVEW